MSIRKSNMSCFVMAMAMSLLCIRGGGGREGGSEGREGVEGREGGRKRGRE